jgi:hypothetical protein
MSFGDVLFLGDPMKETRILEKIELLIPGFRGYKQKELRREDDKLLRTQICERLEDIKTDFEYMEDGIENIDELERCEKIIQEIQKLIDLIEHADYGYAGFFDRVHVENEELDRVYEHDKNILEKIEEIRERENAKNTLKNLRSIERDFKEREKLMVGETNESH